jgi:hypothetical protein
MLGCTVDNGLGKRKECREIEEERSLEREKGVREWLKRYLQTA